MKREGVLDSPNLSLDVLILMNMLDKHFTRSSETLLGVLSTSDTLSSDELDEVCALSCSDNLQSNWARKRENSDEMTVQYSYHILTNNY